MTSLSYYLRSQIVPILFSIALNANAQTPTTGAPATATDTGATDTASGPETTPVTAGDTSVASTTAPVGPTTTTPTGTAPATSTPSDETPPPPSPTIQKSGPKKMLVLFGPGFGLSFLYPKEINDYLDYWVDNLGTTSTEQGSTAIFMALQPRLSLTFAPIEYVQIQFILGEIAWAPKIMAVVGGSSESFHYLRVSTGGTVSGHIPLDNGRKSLSFGAGVLFNYLTFDHIAEVTPGYRGIMAFRFYGRKSFAPEIFLEFNWIRADTGRDPDGRSPGEIGELDYVSGTIGANFYFKVFEKK